MLGRGRWCSSRSTLPPAHGFALLQVVVFWVFGAAPAPSKALNRLCFGPG